MTMIRRLILAAVLMAGLNPAIAQVPPPVPALPDTERRTTYSLSGTTCICNVNFALYGDSTDYANWLTVWINGVQIAQAGNWTITSPTGSLATIPRPITDAVLTFTVAQTGTVQIVGARRPRRTSQFNENAGVSARNLNQVITDLTAQNREFWDKINDTTGRSVRAPPGETMNILPPAAGRASMNACFDSNGMLTSCVGSSSGSFAAGNGISFSGTNPTTITNNISAGTGINITGTNPLVISVAAGVTVTIGSTVVSGGTSLGFLYNNAGVLGNSSFLEQVTSGTNGPTIRFGTNPASGDDAAALVTRALAPASGLLNSHAFRDETAAVSAATASAFSGYASFDSAFTVTGTNVTAMNHMHGFQARAVYNGSGHVNEWAGFTSQPTVSNGGGIIDNAYGFFALNNNIVAGGVTNQYAFYANPLSGASNSYFLYQGLPGNPSVLSGNLYVGGAAAQISTERMNVTYNGSSTQGFLFNDTFGSAGTLAAVSFYRNGSQVGSITTSLANTAYNTSSDERLKDFLGPYDPKEAIRIIRADPVREFEWKFGHARAIGWGAQTSFAISSDLAAPGDADPNKKLGDKGFKSWGVDMGKRTPYLWAAMTDVLDRLDAIEQHLGKGKNHALRFIDCRDANGAGWAGFVPDAGPTTCTAAN